MIERLMILSSSSTAPLLYTNMSSSPRTTPPNLAGRKQNYAAKTRICDGVETTSILGRDQKVLSLRGYECCVLEN